MKIAAVTQYVVHDDRPLSDVDKEGFRRNENSVLQLFPT